MGFSSRLQRFAQTKSGTGPALEGPVAAPPERGTGDGVEAGPPEPAAAASAQARVLEDLRARMAKALAKHDAKRDRASLAREARGDDEPDRAPYRESLPLEPIENAAGTFERRLRSESPFVRVGGVALADALEASFPWLGVLALDEGLAGCSLEGALFLDTETTGLAGGTGTVAFLVGLAWWSAEEERFVTELLFLPSFASEEAMLEHLEARLRRAKCLVTFNGKSFDVPLLKTRFTLHRRAFPFEGPHLDLLHVARRLHRGRDFGVRLQALEQALFGLERVDDIPSAQVAQAYLGWLRGGDSAPVRAVLEHNAQDVLTMVGLVALYGRPPAESRLQGRELVAAARTATKAKALAHAKEVLEAAAQRGLESGFAREFHLAKAALCKQEAAWSSAVSSLEEARAWLDDEAVRLDLAKLYEHRLRDARAALEVAERGTGEGAEGTAKRKGRLERKAAGATSKRAQAKLPGID
jgi:hypothetical protein